MAAGVLIRRFLLIFVLSEMKYSSVFPSVGTWGRFQVTFDPGFHHHHQKPVNPLTKYLLRLKEGLLELPDHWYHKPNQLQCCDGDSKVPHHPVKPPVPICGPKTQGSDCPLKQSPTHLVPKWPNGSHGPSHPHLRWPFFNVLHGLLFHKHPWSHTHDHDHDHCSGHQHPHHCGLHKHHHGPVFHHPHHGPGHNRHHHHHHHHPHHHQQKVKAPHHGCDPHSKFCS